MDIVAFDREFPKIHPEDYVVLHDTGAYYHASYSYYNSRCPPIFIGYRSAADGTSFEFELMSRINTVHDTVDFFSL